MQDMRGVTLTHKITISLTKQEKETIALLKAKGYSMNLMFKHLLDSAYTHSEDFETMTENCKGAEDRSVIN
jgi:hypothetical protein